jgi:hypothetical protein
LAQVFVGGDFWERDIVGEPIDGECVSDTEGAGDVALVTAVVFSGRADVPAVDAVGRHVCALGGCDVDDDASAGRGERALVEVEVAVDAGVG